MLMSARFILRFLVLLAFWLRCLYDGKVAMFGCISAPKFRSQFSLDMMVLLPMDKRRLFPSHRRLIHCVRSCITRCTWSGACSDHQPLPALGPGSDDLQRSTHHFPSSLYPMFRSSLVNKQSTILQAMTKRTHQQIAIVTIQRRDCAAHNC
jgi:hypothetical protein